MSFLMPKPKLPPPPPSPPNISAALAANKETTDRSGALAGTYLGKSAGNAQTTGFKTLLGQ